MFVGCSNWSHQDKRLGYEQHRSTAIPPTIREDILHKMFNNLPVNNDDVADTPPCHHIAHPQTKKKITPTCSMSNTFYCIVMLHFSNYLLAYNHIKNGRAIVGLMETNTSCEARLSILVPCCHSLNWCFC